MCFLRDCGWQQEGLAEGREIEGAMGNVSLV